MLPGATVPCSLTGLVAVFRPCFTAPAFRTFIGLVVGLIGQTRRLFCCELRMVSIDGSTSDLPDTPANVGYFSRPSNDTRDGAFPQVRWVVAAESGTGALTGATLGPLHRRRADPGSGPVARVRGGDAGAGRPQLPVPHPGPRRAGHRGAHPEPPWVRERLGFRPPRPVGRWCQHTRLRVQSVSCSRWMSGFFRGCTSEPTRRSRLPRRVVPTSSWCPPPG